MNGPRDYHSKQSKSERKRQIPYDITYMWNLKYYTDEHTNETETDSQKQRTGSRGQGEEHWEGRTGSLGLADAHYHIFNG